MSYDSIMRMASAGMSLEKLRFDVAAENIANQHNTRNADGTPFTPHSVVATALPFDQMIDGTSADAELVPQRLPENKVYQPGHPEADAKGYVHYPGISTVDETITMMRASRAFEADVKMMNMARSMIMLALSIGEER